MSTSSLLWQEMDLCRETIWDTPNDGVQYAKLEEVDHIYGFQQGLVLTLILF